MKDSNLNRREFNAMAVGAAIATLVPPVLPILESPQRLFKIWDNAKGYLQWEERSWMAIYAHTEHEALDVYYKHYEYPHELERDCVEVVSVHDIDRRQILDDPNATIPQIENNYRVLRQLGWRDERDVQCDCCGLYEMDIVKVCPECFICDDCGCECVPV